MLLFMTLSSFMQSCVTTKPYNFKIEEPFLIPGKFIQCCLFYSISELQTIMINLIITCLFRYPVLFLILIEDLNCRGVTTE